jgi:diketogulonate reductase-like aldo/keto reductase
MRRTKADGDGRAGSPEAQLSRLLGGADVKGGDAGKALEVISATFAKRFNGRAPTKPIDLTHFIGKDSKVSPALLGELAVLDAETAESVAAALETLHRRAVPKLGIGSIAIHQKMAGKSPYKVAYDNGARLFPLLDPIPFLLEANNNVEVGNDLRECDLSDALVMSVLLPFVAGDADAKTFVRKSFDALIEALGPLQTGEGQPLIDLYQIGFPTFVGLPGKTVVDAVAISDAWAAMEALVDEGLVRALGVSNFTQAQLDILVARAKYRPATVQQERHIQNHMEDFLAFTDARKLGYIACVPLATGDILDSTYLQAHPTLTPPQAALHWNMVRDVAVIPGVDTIDHIVENCATLTKLDAAPVEAPEPENVLRKVYPVWPLHADLLCHTGTAADAGTFITGEDGKLRAGKDEAKLSARAAVELNAEQAKLLRDFGEVVGCIEMFAAPGDKRKAIDDKLAATSEQVQATSTAEAEQATSAQQSQDLKQTTATKAHQISAGASGGANLATTVVVPFAKWVAAGKIPRRSDKTSAEGGATLVPAGTLKPGDRVVFFSQRWLTPVGDPASPDDAVLTKYKACTAAARAWASAEGVAEEQLFIWIDYSCIEQDDVSELVRGVNSLGLYVASSDVFITIEHDAYFDRGWCLMECLFADASKVPRFLMTAAGELRPMAAEERAALKRPNQGNFTVESDRKIMIELEAMSQLISSQLERGAISQLEAALCRKAEEGGEGGELEGEKNVSTPRAKLEEARALDEQLSKQQEQEA